MSHCKISELIELATICQLVICEAVNYVSLTCYQHYITIHYPEFADRLLAGNVQSIGQRIEMIDEIRIETTTEANILTGGPPPANLILAAGVEIL